MGTGASAVAATLRQPKQSTEQSIMKTAIIAIALATSFSAQGHETCDSVVRYKNCVHQEEVIEAWETALGGPLGYIEISDTITIVGNCDPCSCSGDKESSACYEYKAEQARKKEEREEKRAKDLQESRELLERTKNYGICPD
jgi:hypothetical protein